MKPISISRRGLVKAAALGTLAAPMLNIKSVYAQSGAFNWKKFAGQSIEVSLTLSPRGELLRRHEKEFTDLTGIKVGSEMVPEQQHRQQAVIQFNSGNPQFDVITISWHVQKRLFGKSKWLVDMKPLLADRALTAPEYDFSDFTAGGLRWAVQGDGR
ncbi:MAG: extracellular solute-binding protein, partial [Hyphomicrobium sp.]|nr:extracellular solute-binding protein [Hyphomicrobium sp.]